MKFAGKVYCGNMFVGHICANSFTALKRVASRKCNNYFHAVDTMILHRINDNEEKELKFTRINRLAPNNTVVRGQWG